MHRKALILTLAIALVFAAIPGVATLAFAESRDGGADATVLITDRAPGTDAPVAFGLDTGDGCPGEDAAPQATF